MSLRVYVFRSTMEHYNWDVTVGFLSVLLRAQMSVGHGFLFFYLH